MKTMLHLILVFLPWVCSSSDENRDVFSIDHVRSDVVVKNEIVGEVELALESEKLLSGNGTTFLATIHSQKGRVSFRFSRLTFWKVIGNEYSPIHVFEASGGATMEMFEQFGSSFLFAQLREPSAGAVWEATAIFFIDNKGNLEQVRLLDPAKCDVELPLLTLDDDGSTRGQVYRLVDSVVCFETYLWRRDDPPNFPSGGFLSGTLKIQRLDNGSFVAEIEKCTMRHPD